MKEKMISRKEAQKPQRIQSIDGRIPLDAKHNAAIMRNMDWAFPVGKR